MSDIKNFINWFLTAISALIVIFSVFWVIIYMFSYTSPIKPISADPRSDFVSACDVQQKTPDTHTNVWTCK